MAIQSYLTKIEYGNTPSPSGSTTYTPFANVISIKPPAVECKDIDVTVLDSPAQFEQFAAGWANGGEAEFKIQFDRTQNATIYGMFRQQLAFQVVFPDVVTSGNPGSQLTFPGYIKKFGNEVDRENVVQADVTIKVTGQPTFTAAV